MESIVLVNPLEERGWDELVESHPLGTTYHHSSWLNVLVHTYPQLRIAALALRNSDRTLQAALPFAIVNSRLGTRFVSMSFTPYCDPLVADLDQFTVLLRPVLQMVDDSAHFELRVLHTADMVSRSLTEHPFHHKNHLLDVSGGIEKVREGFHRSCTRKSIRKAIKSGVTVREGSSEEDLKLFFRLHGRTRKRLGLPIQPYGFFRNMWRSMFPDRLVLLIAEKEGRSIGGLIAFRHPHMVSLEHIGYDDSELPARPNHLLYASAIEKACEEGYPLVDFGKTSPNNQGLLDFKRRWGAEEVEVAYFVHPASYEKLSLDEETAARRLFRTINRALPLPLAHVLGRMVYREIG